MQEPSPSSGTPPRHAHEHNYGVQLSLTYTTSVSAYSRPAAYLTLTNTLRLLATAQGNPLSGIVVTQNG